MHAAANFCTYFLQISIGWNTANFCQSRQLSCSLSGTHLVCHQYCTGSSAAGIRLEMLKIISMHVDIGSGALQMSQELQGGPMIPGTSTCTSVRSFDYNVNGDSGVITCLDRTVQP